MSIYEDAKERMANGDFYNHEKELVDEDDRRLSYHGKVMKALVKSCMKKPAVWKYELLELYNYEFICFASANGGFDGDLDDSVWYDAKRGYDWYTHPTKRTMDSFGKWMAKEFNAKWLYAE